MESTVTNTPEGGGDGGGGGGGTSVKTLGWASIGLLIFLGVCFLTGVALIAYFGSRIQKKINDMKSAAAVAGYISAGVQGVVTGIGEAIGAARCAVPTTVDPNPAPAPTNTTK